MKKTIAVTILLLAGILPSSAVSFATQRLQAIANCMKLQGLDTLSEGQHDSLFWVRKHPVTLRVNHYGEVEHIGLLLFSKEMRQLGKPFIYDFLERDLLERNLPNITGAIKHDLLYEPVFFIKGNAQTPFSFNGSEEYSEERIDYKKYRSSWSRADDLALRITFDMDYHMISGCNAIELEKRFITCLQRFERHEHDTVANTLPPTEGPDIYVVEGDTFLIHEMNNELLFEHDEEGWHLTDSLSFPTKSLRNMMTSLEFRGEPQLNLTFDKYGYETEQLEVPYKNWLQQCMDEGCIPYFGIKHKTQNGYDGTVLMVNRHAGYLHMLSMAITNEEMAKGGNAVLTGRLYVYIPLHNVDDIFFKERS